MRAGWSVAHIFCGKIMSRFLIFFLYFSLQKQKGFSLIYAILLFVSLSMVFGFFVQNSQIGVQTHSLLHSKVQLELYAHTAQSMFMLCLRKHNIQTCNHQNFTFPHNYQFYIEATQFGMRSLILDISGSVTHPSSGNISRITRRSIVLYP